MLQNVFAGEKGDDSFFDVVELTANLSLSSASLFHLQRTCHRP